MKKKLVIIFCFIILIIIIGVGVLLLNNKKKTDNKTNNLILYSKEGNIIYDASRINEVTETIKDAVIQGRVELNHNGYIYIFNGQHFGEFGLEMEEYTRANIKDNNQTCIDYLTLEKYNTSYIQEGDLLICTGDLRKKGYSMGDNDFDTKNNAIVVLKSNDYNKMVQDALKGNRAYPSVITIGDAYIESGYLYLKYSLEDDTHSDTGYNFPFAVKAYITDNTKISGDLEKGKTVKVKYENENMENLKLQSIETIEN